MMQSLLKNTSIKLIVCSASSHEDEMVMHADRATCWTLGLASKSHTCHVSNILGPLIDNIFFLLQGMTSQVFQGIKIVKESNGGLCGTILSTLIFAPTLLIKYSSHYFFFYQNLV